MTNNSKEKKRKKETKTKTKLLSKNDKKSSKLYIHVVESL